MAPPSRWATVADLAASYAVTQARPFAQSFPVGRRSRVHARSKVSNVAHMLALCLSLISFHPLQWFA
ncbi:hypothetical protein ACVW19_005069 [Streptomyces sp. TE5632]